MSPLQAMDPDESMRRYNTQVPTSRNAKDNDKDIAGTRVQQARASPVREVEDRVLEGPFVYWYGRAPIEGD